MCVMTWQCKCWVMSLVVTVTHGALFPCKRARSFDRNTAVGRTETIEYVGQHEFDAAYIPKAITWVVGLLEGVGGVIFIFTAETLR